MLFVQPGSGARSQLGAGVTSFELDFAGTSITATMSDGTVVRILV
jgi:hypothetical protein